MAATIDQVDFLLTVFEDHISTPTSVPTLDASPIRFCDLVQEGYEFLHLLLNLLDTNHVTFRNLKSNINGYTIDSEASWIAWRSRTRVDDTNRFNALYLSLDKYRSRLNPLHSKFGNTTAKYWESTLLGHIDIETNTVATNTMHELHRILLHWYHCNLLIFAQYTSSPRRPDDVFYIPLFGQNGIFMDKSKDNKVSIGITLIPPDYHYDAHYHPAEEVYIPLISGVSWLSSYDPSTFKVVAYPKIKWSKPSCGSVIHHPPSILHAMKTDTTPGMALYCWWGDVESRSCSLDAGYKAPKSIRNFHFYGAIIAVILGVIAVLRIYATLSSDNV